MLNNLFLYKRTHLIQLNTFAIMFLAILSECSYIFFKMIIKASYFFVFSQRSNFLNQSRLKILKSQDDQIQVEA